MVGVIAARDENRLFQFLFVHLLEDIFKKCPVSLAGQSIKLLRLREGLVITGIQKERVFVVRSQVHDLFIEKTADLDDIKTLGIALKRLKIPGSEVQVEKPLYDFFGSGNLIQFLLVFRPRER